MRRKDKLPGPMGDGGTGDNMRFIPHRGSGGVLRVDGLPFAPVAI
jgi:hypothetical protein